MRAIKLGLVALASVAVILSVSSAAYAWNPIDSCGPHYDTTSAYTVNPNGWGSLDFETQVLPAVDGGFVAWEEPCCSGFRADYRGTSSRTGTQSYNGESTISYEGSSWPSQFGNPNQVIAVTLPQWGRGCILTESDMVFNGVGFSFSTNGVSGTDLQSIMTHEQGHWLGLDHETTSCGFRDPDRLTMCPSYSNGTDERTLAEDDVNGVCGLYPADCSCSSNADCEADEECIDSVCQVPPCTSNADCASGLECNLATGSCVVPPCGSDADCPGDQICDNGTCRVDADCTICAECSGQDDCGGAGFTCAETGFTPPFCTKVCNSQADCPGDSQCFDTGQGFAVCLNPQAASGQICPDTYVCTDDGGGTTNPCDGVTCPSGQSCNPSTGQCVGGGSSDCVVCERCSGGAGDCGGVGICADFGGGGVCTLECGSDVDCPGDNTGCFQVQNQDGSTISLCLNDSAGTGGVCPGGFVCMDDAPANPCDGVSCPAGQTCNPTSGVCEGGDTPMPDAGGGVDGGPVGGECTVCGSCSTDADCGAGGECVSFGDGNVCSFDCSLGNECPGDSECFTVPGADGVDRSLCLNPDAATGGICNANYSCTVPVDQGGGDTGVDGAEGSDEARSSASDDCSCSTQPRPNGWMPFAGMLAALALIRRRR